jgi:polyhydroxyalkanoate synthesis repressor PhaR
MPFPDPQLIQVNKYPNRRLYDQTRSRHLTHEELYDLVIAGHTVQVTESKTGIDITNLVLTQALIERSPEKFASFPPELFHLMIRASEQMLRGMAVTWFSQMMQGMGGVAGAAGVGGVGGAGTTESPARPAAAPAAAANPWSGMAGFPWLQPQRPPAPATTQAAPQPSSDPVGDLQARMEAMMREIAELKKRKG